MQQIIPLATFLGLVSLAVTSPAPAQDNAPTLAERLASGVLRWGGDAEGGAPYQLRDPYHPDRVIGFEVELVEALDERLAKRIGRPLRAEFVQYDWGSLIGGLTSARDFDLIASGLEITPETATKVRFTRPYYAYRQELTVRAGEERIRALSDCVGHPVGTMAATAADRLLQKIGVKQIVAFDGQVEPYLDLELGRVDAVLLDTPIAIYYARTNPKLRSLGAVGDVGHYGMALRLDDVLLAQAIDEELAELMISGQLAEILRQWHLWNDDQATLASGPRREAELAGLGFLPDGQPLPAGQSVPGVLTESRPTVDVNIIAASAKLWTFDQYAPVLLKAAGMTIFLSVVSMALAMTLGLLVSMAGLYGPLPVRWLAAVYVEFFRGIPLLLLLFFLYFGLASYGFALPAIATAILGFGLNYAAYEAQIYRTSLLNVPRGQWEAGRSLGMSDATVFRRIVLPQAFRFASGPMTNDFVALFKETSLVSVIAVEELTKEYLVLARSSMKFVELGLMTAALYLLMSIPLGYLSRYLEKRWNAGGAT